MWRFVFSLRWWSWKRVRRCGKGCGMSEDLRRRLDYLEWVAQDFRELDDAESMELSELSDMFYGKDGNPHE